MGVNPACVARLNFPSNYLSSPRSPTRGSLPLASIATPAAPRQSSGPYTPEMDRLWTPWRYTYITGQDTNDAGQPRRKGVPDALSAWPGPDRHCVFCNLLAATRWARDVGIPAEVADRAALLILETPACFICLNRFPYSTGHLLLLPIEHTSSLAALPSATAAELIHLAQRAEGWLRELYTPDGLNFGMNLGEAAGAGVAGHLHLHALPRWVGDGSFMTTTAETRILPETLDITWSRLRQLVTSGTTSGGLPPSS